MWFRKRKTECSFQYHGPEVDIWSLGVVLFVIVTGFIPFNDSNHIMNIRYHWPKARTYSDGIKLRKKRRKVFLGSTFSYIPHRSFVESIFQPSELRIKMNDLIMHRWLNDDGRLPVITRQALQIEQSMVNGRVIQKMVELGFNEADTRKAVVEDHHNQLTTTYYLLVHQVRKKESCFLVLIHNFAGGFGSAAAQQKEAQAFSADPREKCLRNCADIVRGARQNRERLGEALHHFVKK